MTLRSNPTPACPLCGESGEMIHPQVEDHLFGVPGAWGFRRCLSLSCRLLWLDPSPFPEDLGEAYRTYYTHGETTPAPSAPVRPVRRELVRLRKNLARIFFDLLVFSVVLGGKPSFWERAQEAYESRIYRGKRLQGWSRIFYTLFLLNPARKSEVDFRYMYTKPRPGGSLLELGCGDGWLLSLMHAGGWNVEGLDFDPAAVEQARRRGVAVRLGGLVEQGYPEARFDLIVASHFLEHVHDPGAVLQEAWRLLRPGGRLVFVTPNASGLGHWVFGSHWRGLEPPRHIQIFSPRNLARLARTFAGPGVRAFTTTRDIHHLFYASLSLKEDGLHSWQRPIQSTRMARARALAWVERCLSIVFPDLGEELVLVVDKPQ